METRWEPGHAPKAWPNVVSRGRRTVFLHLPIFPSQPSGPSCFGVGHTSYQKGPYMSESLLSHYKDPRTVTAPPSLGIWGQTPTHTQHLQDGT